MSKVKDIEYKINDLVVYWVEIVGADSSIRTTRDQTLKWRPRGYQRWLRAIYEAVEFTVERVLEVTLKEHRIH